MTNIFKCLLKFKKIEDSKHTITDAHFCQQIHSHTSHEHILDLLKFISAYTKSILQKALSIPQTKAPKYWKTIYSRLHLCWPSRHITHSILPPHGATVCNFNLQSLDFFGKFDPLGICQRFTLLIYIPYVQNFAHEFNHRLRLVKSRCRNCQQMVYAIYAFYLISFSA
jgi:hypothetical protein